MRVRGDMGYTLNGPTISAWADQSGNAIDYVQATPANQPLWLSQFINSRQALLFDDTNDRLQPTGSNTGTNWIYAHDGTGFQLFGVADLSGDGAIIATCAVVTTDIGFIIDYTTGQLRITMCDANAGGANVTVAANISAGLHQFTFVFATALTPDITIFIDGTSAATGNLTRAAPSSDATAGANIGTRSGGTVPIGAKIGELLAYGGVMANSDRMAVESYLRNYWHTP